MKNQSGISRIGFIILTLVIILGVYFLITEVFFNENNNSEKVENEIVGHTNSAFEKIDKNNIKSSSIVDRTNRNNRTNSTQEIVVEEE